MKKLRLLSWLFKIASVVNMLFSGSSANEEPPGNKRHRIRPGTWKKIGAVVFLIVAIGAAAVALDLMFSGPRMRIQPKYLPYQAQMPPVPEGIVPVSLPEAMRALPLAAQLENPLQDTERTRATGQVYYSYYCAFCHGKAGEVTGPVGRSYMPAPTPLSSPRVQAMSDGELYRAMLTGAGHEPVLDYVIGVRARWYIVSYVRTMASERP